MHAERCVAMMLGWSNCNVSTSSIDVTLLPFQTAAAEGIDCNFKSVDGYLFPASASQDDLDTIDKELAAAVRAGLTDVRKVTHYSRPVAIRSSGQV